MQANLKTCLALQVEERRVAHAREQVRRYEALQARAGADAPDAAMLATDLACARSILAVMEEQLHRLQGALPALDAAAWRPTELPLSEGDRQAIADARRRRGGQRGA